MNARPDWTDVAERAHLHQMSVAVREADQEDEVASELRAEFLSAIKGNGLVAEFIVGRNGMADRERLEFAVGLVLVYLEDAKLQQMLCDVMGGRVKADAFNEALADVYVKHNAADIARLRAEAEVWL
jgi:hypothetical protein